MTGVALRSLDARFEAMHATTGRRSIPPELFTVDGTLVQAWASQKSFRPRDGGPPAPPDDPGNPSVDFRGADKLFDHRPFVAPARGRTPSGSGTASQHSGKFEV